MTCIVGTPSGLRHTYGIRLAVEEEVHVGWKVKNKEVQLSKIIHYKANVI